MKISKYLLLAVLFSPLFTSCADYNEQSVDALETGTADFTKYVAVGNSLAAGFQSNALYPEGQAYSYPNFLAQTFRVSSFAQPAIGNGYGDRVDIADLSNPLAPVTTITSLSPGVLPTQPAGGYQNLGIPGAILDDYLGGVRSDAGGNTVDTYLQRLTGSNGPAYAYVLGTSGKTISAYLKEQNPTFVSFWLGNNDILGYVTSGGLRPFTSPTAFAASYASSISDILSSNANMKMAVANIPGVTSIPFATYVGPIAKQLLTASLPPSVTSIYASATFYNGVAQLGMAENKFPYAGIPLANLDKPDSAMVLITGQAALGWIGASSAVPGDAAKVTAITNYWKGFIVAATAGTANAIPASVAGAMDNATLAATMKQLITGLYMQTFLVDAPTASAALTARGFDVNFAQPFGLHPHNPIPNQFILDKNEISIAKTVTGLFNGAISQVVAANTAKIAFVDMNGIFKGIVTAGSVTANGVTLRPALGSLFSFDGVHPSNRGHGILTNEIIKAINAKFNSNLPPLMISRIPLGYTVNQNPS